MRFSTLSVSGRRTSIQPHNNPPPASKAPKIHSQLATSRMACPRPGARMGAAMKKVMAMEMICAILRPETRSRTTAVAMTRVPAAAAP